TTLTPLAADSKSNPRHEKSVTSITNRKSGLSSLSAELAAALGGGEDSIEEGGAGARPLEGAQAGGGGAARRGDGRPELLRRLPRPGPQGGGAPPELGGGLGAHVARQPGQHARLHQGLHHQEQVGRARARQPGDGVE